jgi:DnaK suppressor protein
MTQAQLIRFKKSIEKRRLELLTEIRSQTSQIVIGDSDHDPIDQVQAMHLREECATHLGRRSLVLAEVDRSLQAILEGSYGICVDCEEPIASSVWKSYHGHPAAWAARNIWNIAKR